MWHFCEADFMKSERLKKCPLSQQKEPQMGHPSLGASNQLLLPPSSSSATLSPINAGFQPLL